MPQEAKDEKKAEAAINSHKNRKHENFAGLNPAATIAEPPEIATSSSKVDAITTPTPKIEQPEKGGIESRVKLGCNDFFNLFFVLPYSLQIFTSHFIILKSKLKQSLKFDATVLFSLIL